ncbi:MAG: VRR-NUC domain-containing protein [Nanohaloarchaea archaeon]|nr:VRR-NUC domain-containing protein [Candidatus Nanohaloarchaea archaeon]
MTASEEYAQEILESNWKHVVRTTPGMLEDLEQKYPKLCDLISQNILEDAGKRIDNIFRTGVPDFLVFSDKGDYKFVEVKSGEDGLRHTQLDWLREFEGIKAEIWFTEKREVEKQLDTDNISAYTFQDRKGESSSSHITSEKDSNLFIELPKTLASIIGLSKEDSFDWRLKSKDELILDSK